MDLEKRIIDYFVALKRKKILGSAYIFIGHNFVIVEQLLRLINCDQDEKYCDRCWSCQRIKDRHHPDLFIVKPQNLSIKIDGIREAIRFLSMRSYSSPKKILLVKDADKMTQESSNLFLKTLEEPPKNSFIGLCVPKLEDVLPTIISRCRKIYLPYSFPQSSKDSVAFLAQAEALQKQGIIPFFKNKNRKDFALFLESLIVLLHNQLKSLSGASTAGSSSKVKQKSVKLIEAIEAVFELYGAYRTVNINLALNLIAMRLK